MKKKKWLPLLLLLLFAQCSKNKGNSGPDLQKGLVAWFKLDNDFIDYSGNISSPAHTGNLLGAYDRKGNGNNAVFFKAGLLSFSVDDWKAEQISVSLWMKPENLTSMKFVTCSVETTFAIYQEFSKLYWQVYNGSLAKYAMGIIGAGWTHVAGTSDGKEIKLYLNGVLVDTESHPGNTPATKTVHTGARYAEYWPGTIDDLRYYNRALTQEEVTLLANQ